MHNEEYQAIYDDLESYLRQLGLSWVVDEVNNQISVGKVEKQSVDTFKDERLNPNSIGRMKKKAKAQFDVVVEYAPKEKLMFLIEAIERAIVNSAQMAFHITQFFSGEVEVDNLTLDAMSDFQIQFSDGTASENLRLTYADAIRSAEQAEILSGLLENLRMELRNDD